MQFSRGVRIGILLSLVWVAGAAVYTHDADVKGAEDYGKGSYEVCADTKRIEHSADLSSCDAERTKNVKMRMEHSTGNAAIAGLAPVPFAWLAVFILIYVVRAQFIGFRAVVPWGTLNTSKKLFVAFCWVFGLVTLGCAGVVVLNLYVDTKVPVSMSPSLLVIGDKKEYVTATGTWTRTDLIGDTIAYPLQRSRIECYKAENRCTEALASVAETTLLAHVVEYEIQSWTPDAIVLRREYLCATELFTIDLNTKSVSGAGHKVDASFCGMSKDDKASWTLELSDSFKVYWELRQRARPWPLRVIQSALGD